MKLHHVVFVGLLACGSPQGKSGTSPDPVPASATADPVTAPATATPDTAAPAADMEAFGKALMDAVAEQNLDALSAYWDAAGDVSVRAGCDKAAITIKGGTLRAWFVKSAGNWFPGEAHEVAPECSGACCTIRSGASSMCDACVDAVKACLSPSPRGKQAIANVTITNTAGVSCEDAK